MLPDIEHVPAFLLRLRKAVQQGHVEVRGYAKEGLRSLEWTVTDLRLQLLDLSVDDFLRTEESSNISREIIWIFTPEFWDGGYLWIRLVERSGIVVISFHKG
jgi:hypothetical protein